ncbi:MAG: cytochrome c biogenesis protein ResB [Deltaproteobacteria bacterium]|nr:cytochrome c biogenesis protein ResB [Deltaproteobacteria bacterium]
MARNGTVSKRTPPFLWSTFSSIKLTIFLLILVAVTSILGTLIPQQESAMKVVQSLSPSLVGFLDSLHLFDMYHSWWFRLIIGALALNLIVCSLDRFSSTLKRFRFTPSATREKPFENLPSEQRFLLQASFDSVTNHVGTLLKSKYKNVKRVDKEKTAFYFVQKGRLSHFGVYLVHFSVLLILLGGFAGSLFGFEAFVNILEGEGVDTVTLRKTRALKPLPFSVRCDKFSVEFYPNGTPKEYRSDLVFFKDGRIAFQSPLRVNHPITFEGITFYQSSYGTLPGNRVRLSLKREDTGDNAFVEAEINQPFPLPGREGEGLITEIKSDFMRMGPAVRLEIQPVAGEKIQMWVFKNHSMIEERFPGIFEKFPKLNPASFKPYTFFLNGTEARYYTGLQVSRDPGVPLVWTGFVTIIVGLFITFFLSHRMIWIQVSRLEKGVNVALAGTSSKNSVGLSREIGRLIAQIRGTMDDIPSSC